MYVHMYLCTMYVNMYACLYICMGALDNEQIPPNIPLHKLFSCVMKNGLGAT